MKFCSLVLEIHLPQNFCHTQTGIFQKQSNHVQDILKHVNMSTKNRKSKICTKPLLSSIYIEESRHRKEIIKKKSRSVFEKLANEVFSKTFCIISEPNFEALGFLIKAWRWWQTDRFTDRHLCFALYSRQKKYWSTWDISCPKTYIKCNFMKWIFGSHDL